MQKQVVIPKDIILKAKANKYQQIPAKPDDFTIEFY